jgi:hypothetical protein
MFFCFLEFLPYFLKVVLVFFSKYLGLRYSSNLSRTGQDLKSLLDFFLFEYSVSLYSISLVLGINLLSLYSFSGCNNFSGARIAFSGLVWPEQLSILYIKPDIIVGQLLPSKNKVVVS